MFLITLIELEGHPVLRITVNGEVKDYWLRRSQATLLLSQLADYISRNSK